MANVPKSSRGGAAQKAPSLFTDLLRVAAHLTAEALSRIYASRLPLSEWRILAALAEHGTITGKAIGLYADLHKTKVSRTIASLEQRNLVSRSVNPEDLRAPLISLTPDGEKIHKELAPLADAVETQLLSALEPADRAALERALQRITEQSQQIIRRQGIASVSVSGSH